MIFPAICLIHAILSMTPNLLLFWNYGIIRNWTVRWFCSANSLEQSAGMTAKEFFPLLREKKSSHLTQLWEDYLIHLAFAIKNINMIVDAPIIISGYLAPFFTEEDIQILLKNVNSASPFPLDRPQILIGNHGQYTPAIGAALFYVDQFIRSV